MNIFFDHEKLDKGIVCLLVGLIRSNSPDRLHEEPTEYRVEEREQD